MICLWTQEQTWGYVRRYMMMKSRSYLKRLTHPTRSLNMWRSFYVFVGTWLEMLKVCINYNFFFLLFNDRLLCENILVSQWYLCNDIVETMHAFFIFILDSLLLLFEIQHQQYKCLKSSGPFKITVIENIKILVEVYFKKCSYQSINNINQ